jgi:alpha-beta hydrolase superfamily lysophospholipase
MRHALLVAVRLALLCAALGCARKAEGAGPGDPLPPPQDASAPLEPAPSLDTGAGRVDDRTIEPPSPLPGAEANVPEAIELPSADGVTIHASLWRTGDPEAPAVVFVHQARSDRSEWTPFVEVLRAQAPGLTVMTIDLRGHGASTKAGDVNLRWQDFQGGDNAGLRRWAGCTSDVQAAVAYLRSRGEGTIPRAIGLVGSSIGSSSVLRAAANDGVAGPGHIAVVVVLSPGLSYFSVPIRAAVETLKVRKLPVLLIAARDDTNDVGGTAQELQTILAENLQVQLFDDGGHGVAVAAAHPEVIAMVTAFLKARVGL